MSDDGYDDGKVLIAGVLYDEETLEEAECEHPHVEREDDGLGWRGYRCPDCEEIVYPTEDGWEVME